MKDSAALQETVKLLKASGCREDGVAAFQKVVERYNSTPYEFDFSKFPKVEKGIYSFQSATQLVAALPFALKNTTHPVELNCFDLVILLAAGQLQTELRPDDVYGIFLAPQMDTNGAILKLPAATARDAFKFGYYPWYREVSGNFFPDAISDMRISLTPALHGFFVLPAATTEATLGDDVMKTLRAGWRHQSVKFPVSFEIVLCGEIHLQNLSFMTCHAGLLFSRDKGYTYLEKSAGAGPFVRLDLHDRNDLTVWLSGKPAATKKEGLYFFTAFNDIKIEMLPSLGY